MSLWGDMEAIVPIWRGKEFQDAGCEAVYQDGSLMCRPQNPTSGNPPSVSNAVVIFTALIVGGWTVKRSRRPNTKPSLLNALLRRSKNFPPSGFARSFPDKHKHKHDPRHHMVLQHEDEELWR
ncbi:hypothetical protein BU17DRAFT_69186 [Hysterangium stoloniferum]|nr:hypothetical protein BU17DRAFT_69186 [Hysterangium stoloniferum]